MATAAFAKRALILPLLSVAVGAASSCRCDCEAQREEIARLHATIRALRAQASQAEVPEVAPIRRAAGVPTCDGEHVELETDDDVQALQGCRALQRLTIRGDGVTSLAGLQSLETATEISIVTAGTLTSLAGLENLTKVGSFIISFNRNLASLEGLQSLQSAGRMEVLGNLELRSLTGLEQLTRVEGDLSVGQTTWLHSLAGLESLRSVGGLKLQSNRGLRSLAGPESLTTVEGSLEVLSNGVLESLTGLANVTSAESLNVEHNGALESLFGLESLTTVGTLRVFSNDRLRRLDFRSLQRAVNVDVSFNAALESLTGLDHVTSVESLKAVALGVRLVTVDLATEAAAAAAIAALLCVETTVALRARPRATPLARSLSEFKQKLEKQSLTRCCAKGSGRAITVGRLQQLVEFFQEFIRDRTAYYLVSNILWELTKSRKVSYAELVGPGQVEWFVSHFWGTAYAHFCMALRKHAETVCDNGEWARVRYWVCFCSNNQHSIEEELGAGWQESSFYLTLKSGHCRGTCMVLDDQALPLTRIWCIFELLQTVNLQRVDDSFHGLLFCTSSGVLNTGSGSVEVAMALAEKVADMDLATAQATSEVDAERIRSEVIRQMGSFAALNRFVCHEVHDMLGHAQANANQQFAAVLARLKESTAEPVTSAPFEHVWA